MIPERSEQTLIIAEVSRNGKFSREELVLKRLCCRSHISSKARWAVNPSSYELRTPQNVEYFERLRALTIINIHTPELDHTIAPDHIRGGRG